MVVRVAAGVSGQAVYVLSGPAGSFSMGSLTQVQRLVARSGMVYGNVPQWVR
jgi:hypothetical protein